MEIIVKEKGRLDALLAAHIDDVSRSYLQKIIEKGEVSVNGKVETSKKVKLKELSLENYSQIKTGFSSVFTLIQ